MTEAEKIQIEQEVEDGSCEFMHVHEEIVEKVEGVMPDEQQLLDLSEFFKIFCRWASPLFPISSES